MKTFKKKTEEEIFTLKKYFENPSGKGTSQVGSRELIKQALYFKFNDLLFKFRVIEFKTYEDKETGAILFHFKIPSQKKFINVRKLYYDIVLQFYPRDKKEISIYNCEMKIFSNCPSFVFTYSYVANELGILVSFLKDKLGAKSLEIEPSEKNPSKDMGYEKSIFFAILYLRKIALFRISQIKTLAVPLNIEKLRKEISDFDTKLKEYEYYIKHYLIKKRNKKTSQITTSKGITYKGVKKAKTAKIKKVKSLKKPKQRLKRKEKK